MTLPLPVVAGESAFSRYTRGSIRDDLKAVVLKAVEMSGVLPGVVDKEELLHFTDLPPIFSPHGHRNMFPNVDMGDMGEGQVGWFYWSEHSEGMFGSHAGHNLTFRTGLRIPGVAALKASGRDSYSESRDYIDSASKAMLLTLQSNEYKFAVRARDTVILPTNNSQWRYDWQPIGETWFYQCHARYDVEFDLFADRVL